MLILGVRILLMTIISSGRMSKWMFGYVTVPRRVHLRGFFTPDSVSCPTILRGRFRGHSLERVSLCKILGPYMASAERRTQARDGHFSLADNYIALS